MVGAAAGAFFYVPIGKVKEWSWETTWAVASIFSWVFLPIVVSMLLLSDLSGFYATLDSSVIWKTSLLGFVWGIGKVNYGLTMRYLGLSLGIGIIRYAGPGFAERSHRWIIAQHLKVLDAITRCRTAALGGHRDQCADCGHIAISYNSYRNRHCPRCQGNARLR